MRTRYTKEIAALIVIVAGVSLSADRVRLRSGKAVEGQFIGADSKSVRPVSYTHLTLPTKRIV